MKQIEEKRQQINIFNEDKQAAIILGNIEELEKNQKEQINFYNYVLNCEDTIEKIFNIPIKVKYIYIAKQEIKNENNEVIDGKTTHPAPRMVFYTEDGKGYLTFAGGIYYSLKKINEIFGEPPYNFYFMFVKIQKGKSNIYQIQLVEEEETKND